MAIFTMTELASYLRIPFASIDQDLALLLIELTGSEIFGELPQPNPMPGRVKSVALEVAARAYRNPSGASTETAGPFSEGRSAETANAGVYLLDSERSRITTALGAGTSLGTIRLGTPYGRDWASPYVPPYPFVGGATSC